MEGRTTSARGSRGGVKGKARTPAPSRAYAVKDGDWVYAEMRRTYDGGHVAVRKNFTRGTTVAIRERRFLYLNGDEETRAYHVVSLVPGVWQRPILSPPDAARYLNILTLDGAHVKVSIRDLKTIDENTDLYAKRIAKQNGARTR